MTGLDVFQKSLLPCALDESIGRVEKWGKHSEGAGHASSCQTMMQLAQNLFRKVAVSITRQLSHETARPQMGTSHF